MSDRFGMVPAKLFKDHRITTTDIAIYTVIASYAKRNGVAYPTIKLISNEAKKKERWVSARIAHMENLGYIRTRRRRGSHNFYTLLHHPTRISNAA